MDLARGVPIGRVGSDRDGVLAVVDARHVSTEVAVGPVGEVLIPDAGHAIADHPHVHARAEMDPEVDAVQERERRAERVADDGDIRRAVP